MNTHPSITVLPPAIWEPLLNQHFDGNSPKITNQARRILAFSHDQHVPVPPQLALSFAQTFFGTIGIRRDLPTPWGDFLEKLVAQFNPTGDAEQLKNMVSSFSLTPPTVFLIEGLLPLVRTAARGLNEIVLFGASALGMPVWSDDDTFKKYISDEYENYQNDLIQKVKNLVKGGENGTSSEGVLPKAYWEWLAVTARAARNQTRQADPDPILIRYLLAFDFGFETSESYRFHPRQKTLDPNPDAFRPPQGGVTGIRQSISFEDFGDRILSEQFYPPTMQIVRMEEGFFVRHRPPPNIQKRDVLVAVCAPSPLSGHGSVVARIAWLDAAFRLSILLRRMGLKRSTLALVHAADKGKLVVSAQTDIDEQTYLDNCDPWLAGRGDLLQYLYETRWLGQALDRLPTSELPVSSPKSTTPENEEVTRNWLKAAIDHAANGRLTDFSTVIVWLMLEDKVAENWRAIAEHSSITRGLNLTGHYSTGVISFPDTLKAGHSFKIKQLKDKEEKCVTLTGDGSGNEISLAELQDACRKITQNIMYNVIELTDG